jgi:hypothetical protein
MALQCGAGSSTALQRNDVLSDPILPLPRVPGQE